MFDLITAAWFGVLGACVGSFLNVVAYRLPRGMSVVWQPSHCPHCQHPIRARDNVPVLGWLALWGRCRDCGGPISPRYAIVEAIVGAIFVLLAYFELFSTGANLPGGPFDDRQGALYTVWYPNWPLLGIYAYHAVGASLLMAMTLIAIDRTRIPTGLAATAMAIGIGTPLVVGLGWSDPRLPLLWLSEPDEPVGSYLKILAATAVLGWIVAEGAARLFQHVTRRDATLLTITAACYLPGELGKSYLFVACLVLLLLALVARAPWARYYPAAVIAAWLAALLWPLG